MLAALYAVLVLCAARQLIGISHTTDNILATE